MMPATFTTLNEGWNAEPNGQNPRIAIEGSDLVFEFLLNDLVFPKYKTAEKGILRFSDCWRYRLGETNDEGWYRGKCRFSRLAPKWGEFHEVHGDLSLDAVPDKEAFYDAARKMHLAPFSPSWIRGGTEVCNTRHVLL